MMRHFHKDLFSKIYYSPMQLHIAFETGDRNVLKKKSQKSDWRFIVKLT